MLLRAWRHSGLAAATFVAVFFACLAGSKMLLARSCERVVGQWYRPVMRGLVLMLVVFAAIVTRDAVGLLRGVSR